MNAEAAINIFESLVMFALMVMLPFLGTILAVGLMTSLFQSITSIQEQTLTFVPKLVAFAIALMILSPWLLRTVTEFAVRMISQMSSMTG